MSDEVVSFSPSARTATAQDRTLHSFADALQAVVGGAKMTKLEWDDESIYLVLQNEKVMIMNGTFGDGKLHPFIMHSGDIVGDDWLKV